MKLNIIFALLVLALCGFMSVGVFADEKKASPLDAIKALAGKWEGKGDEARNVMPATTEFRVTSNGSAVLEIMSPGTEYEMVNLYSMEGDDLYMVHYCGMGNQPRMKLVKHDAGVMRFESVSVGNHASKDAPFMSGLTLTVNADLIAATWDFSKAGKVESHATFELSKQK
jgi:hypothetical protein